MQQDYATKFIGKIIEIEIDRPIGSKHPDHGFVYDLNYGFIPGTLAPDGEAVDVYLLNVDNPVNSFKGRCIVVIRRREDDDDKVVVVPLGSEDVGDEEIKKMVNFQEKFFDIKVVR